MYHTSASSIVERCLSCLFIQVTESQHCNGCTGTALKVIVALQHILPSIIVHVIADVVNQHLASLVHVLCSLQEENGLVVAYSRGIACIRLTVVVAFAPRLGQQVKFVAINFGAEEI